MLGTRGFQQKAPVSVGNDNIIIIRHDAVNVVAALSFQSNSHLPYIVPFNMREVISLHVGQAGVQIGNACCKSSLSVISPFSLRPGHRGALHARAWTERTCLP